MRLFLRKKAKKTEAEIRQEIEAAVLAEIKMNMVHEIGGTYRGYLPDGTRYVVTVDEPELSEVDLTFTKFDIDFTD